MFQEFTGKEYLKIDIASNYGLDKKPWNHRLAWFDANEANLYNLVNTADEPALFYAGVKAWEDAKAGIPSGYMIGLDATSSGLQLLAALVGDSTAAKLCNVVDTGERENAYENIYNMMLERVGESAKIEADDVKQAVMTSLYSSKAVPKQVFGEGKLLDIFYDVMETAAPAAWELNEAFLAMWDDEALSNDWVLPDNFHVHIKVMNQVKERVHFLNEPFDIFYNENMPIKEGRSLGANTIHSIDGMIVREISRRCDYDPANVKRVQLLLSKKGGTDDSSPKGRMVAILWKHYCESGYLSARILDYLDIDNSGLVLAGPIGDLIQSLPAKPFKVIAIHDCFKCHPNYGNDIRRQYNLQLKLIAQSKLLQFIIRQIIKRNVIIHKMDENLHTQIMEANYALS